MDLSKNTPENIKYVLGEITGKLRMVNTGALRPESIDNEKYEELLEIHDMVMNKDHFSPNEMQALVEEIGKLRKS
ncbi:DUF1128 domain-containing protein [Siminovitchia sediminis]|uniref:UPF0435 protein ACFSCZ_16425 n=1 Tax=Siminovitchia sediminis TaxID=1274353 RepID=A0ABW4KKP9_9BACI